MSTDPDAIGGGIPKHTCSRRLTVTPKCTNLAWAVVDKKDGTRRYYCMQHKPPKGRVTVLFVQVELFGGSLA